MEYTLEELAMMDQWELIADDKSRAYWQRGDEFIKVEDNMITFTKPDINVRINLRELRDAGFFMPVENMIELIKLYGYPVAYDLRDGRLGGN